MPDARYCTNCRAELGRGDETCSACGVFAGELFDGRLPRKPRRGRWIIVFLLILTLTVAAGWLILQRRGSPTELTEPQTISVVSDRPGGSRLARGATVNEAEAIRLLRRHLTSRGIANECIAVSSQGPRQGSYDLTAVDSCAGTRLGRFIVDGKTQAVRPR